MRSFSGILLIALLVCGAVAQKHAVPIVPIVKKAGPSTPPKAVDESDRKKECPAGFNFVGKQCAKTLNAQPDVVCPKGTTLVDGKCAKYVGKIAECPTGYISQKGVCVRTRVAPSELVCPPGFDLSGKDQCITRIALPDKAHCPSGSLVKGDHCVRHKYEAPEWTCPSDYILIGKKCQREETFDCTPARVPREESKKEEEFSKPIVARSSTKGKGDHHYNLPSITPSVEEFVVQKTCKRIITEPARPVCSKAGTLEGKLCRIDVQVQKVVKPGGFRDQVVAAARVCPEGFSEANKGECVATEEVLPEVFCPSGTINVGDRCATYSPTRTICPEGFYLDGKTCTKTIFAAPIVEYTVTYECVGKDCGKNHHAQGHHYSK